MKTATSTSVAIVAAAGAMATAQQTYPSEKVMSTADNGGFVPASGSLDGTQTWLKRRNTYPTADSAFQGNPPTIDGSGNVAFYAMLTAGVGGVVGGPFNDGVGYNHRTWWYGGPGSLSLQARYGDPTLDNANCGGPGAIFTYRTAPMVPTSPSGFMYLGAYQIAGGATTPADRNVMWVGQAGNWHNLVRANDVYLHVGNSQQTGNVSSAQQSNPPRLNNLGQTPFQSTLRLGIGDTTNNNGVTAPNNDWFVGICSPNMSPNGQNSGAWKVVRALDDLLGTGSMVYTYYHLTMNHAASSFGIYDLAINVGGVTATDNSLLVMSTFNGSGYTNTIFGRKGGNTGVGAIRYAGFVTVGRQSLSNSGRAIYLADFEQGVGGIDATNDAALMTHKDGLTSIIAQKGPASAIDPVLPGTIAFATDIAANTNGDYTLSNSDQVAWIGTLAGTGITAANDTFLAVSTIAPDGSVTHKLILREGEQVPDAPAGVLWSQPSGHAINASGIVIFNGGGLWAYFPSCGVTRRIATYGDVLAGLTVAGMLWSVNPNGEGSTIGFNDEGWLGFAVLDGVADAAILRAHFCPADLDDGSGAGQPDGGVDINDLLCFLAQYESGACGADLDGGMGNGLPDGGVDINDLLFFLTHYEGGC